MNSIVFSKIVPNREEEWTVHDHISKVRGGLVGLMDKATICTALTAAASVPSSLISRNARWKDRFNPDRRGGAEMASNRARCGSKASAIPSC